MGYTVCAQKLTLRHYGKEREQVYEQMNLRVLSRIDNTASVPSPKATYITHVASEGLSCRMKEQMGS